jgi:ABC-type glycerol-3-phosphate transport system substrate-binding protein
MITMKKKVTMLCLALAMVISMSACGNKDNSVPAAKDDTSSKVETVTDSSASESTTETTVTTEPVVTSEPESTIDKDAVIVDTDNFEIDKPYYAYSEEANMWLQITHATKKTAYVVIVDNNNVNHSIDGYLMNLKKDGYYTEGNDEIGIVWKYRDIEYKTKDDPMFPFPSNCKPLDYTINGSTVTFTFVEYKDNNTPGANDFVEYIPNSERTVTFKFVTEDYFKANAPEVH